MNCEDVTKSIDGLTAKSLYGPQLAAFDLHLQSCSVCAEYLRQHERYINTVSRLSAPLLTTGKSARLIRLAVEKAKVEDSSRRQRRSFVSGFAAASVLAIAIVFGVSSINITHGVNPDGTQLVSSILGDDNWSQELTIVINAPSNMNNARIVFQLPPDMSIRGHEYLSKVDMPVNLKKGRNVISVPVDFDFFVEPSEQSNVTASLIYKNLKKDFDLGFGLEAPKKDEHSQYNDMLNKIYVEV